MVRRVECLLVGTQGPASADAIDQMAQLARERFAIEPTVLTLAAATKGNVLDALEEAAQRNQEQGALFVALFSGHGGLRQKVLSWRLTDLPLSDDDIIDKLSLFHRDTEIFLVSDCCYGGQFLNKKGPDDEGNEEEMSPELQDELREQMRAFTRRAAFMLEENGAGSSQDKNRASLGQVVLAAASDRILIRPTIRNDFVRALCRAIPVASTYADLQPAMVSCTKPEGDCNWLIDAMPEHGLRRRPLVP